MSATIQDISRAAGVSPSTVSLVLNGKGRVADATRRRVEAVIKQMAYRPRNVGRRSDQAEGLHVAVVYPYGAKDQRGVTDVFAHWSHAVRRHLAGRGCMPSVFVGGRHVDQDVPFQQAVESGEIDGVILMGTTQKDGYLGWIRRAGLPLVVLNRRPVREEFSYVNMDNFGGGRQAGEFLLRRGHKRFAYIGYPLPDDAQTNQMDIQEGFEAALEAGGGTLESVRLFDPHGREGGPSAIQRACREVLDKRVTAIFMAMSDASTADLMDALQGQGVSVPKDISIVNFNNLPSRPSRSGLRPTSVGCDFERLGVVAGDALLNLIKHGREVPFLAATVAMAVVEHDTTAPAPKAADRSGSQHKVGT